MKPTAPSPRQRPMTDFSATLHAAGLRRTAPRVAVLERLAAAKAPLSHAEVAAFLTPAGFDRATVYRVLIDLVETGLARRTDHGDHVWRFELLQGERSNHLTEHPHFLCTDCGGVSCLPVEAVQVLGGRGRPRALTKSAIEVRIRGRCDECAR